MSYNGYFNTTTYTQVTRSLKRICLLR